MCARARSRRSRFSATMDLVLDTNESMPPVAATAAATDSDSAATARATRSNNNRAFSCAASIAGTATCCSCASCARAKSSKVCVTSGLIVIACVVRSSSHSAPISTTAGTNARRARASLRSILARTSAYALYRTFPRQNANAFRTRYSRKKRIWRIRENTEASRIQSPSGVNSPPAPPARTSVAPDEVTV